MKKFALLALLLLACLPWLAAQQYYIEPFFNDPDPGTAPPRSLKLFQLGAAGATQVGAAMDVTPDITTAFGTPGAYTGPNAVLIHRDKLFVSVDREFSNGGVLMYKLADVFPRSADPIALKPGGGGIPSSGMAIQPSTGDLFVATFNGGGIWRFAAPNYTTGTPFASGTPLRSVTSNLAFDKAGNLWASTWDFSTDVNTHLVVCFKGAVASEHYSLASAPVTATDPAGASEVLNAFSAPEGLAFDAAGNLWVANNNDGVGYRTNPNGKGTVTKISAAQIAALLVAPSKLGTAAGATALLIPGGKPGGLSLHGHTLYIGDQAEAVGHKRVSRYDVTQPFSAASYGETGVPASYPGNGSGIPFDALYLQDNAADLGQQPNRSTTAAWLSLDIWVTNVANTTGLPAGVSEPILGGQPCSLFVKLRNTGIAPSLGTETLKVYWAKASTGLGWPAPWTNPVGGGLSMGGSIDTRAVTTIISRGGELIVGFRWNDTPDPKQYTGVFGTDDGHFCLLARLESQAAAPFGMPFPETSALITNVLDNAAIAWRNIHISKTAMKVVGGTGILAGNYTDRPMHTRIGLQLLDAQGQPADFAPGSLRLTFPAAALAKLENTDYNRNLLIQEEGGAFLLQEPGVGLEHLILEPGETFACALAYTPADTTQGYAITATQYALEEDGEHVIGGQTFIFGDVEGFPVAEAATATPDDNPAQPGTYWGLPLWVWLLIFGLLLLLLILFFVLRKKS